MAVFTGISDNGYAEDLQMVKDKLIDGKKLSVGLAAN